jgi:hypothetical protein
MIERRTRRIIKPKKSNSISINLDDELLNFEEAEFLDKSLCDLVKINEFADEEIQPVETINEANFLYAQDKIEKPNNMLKNAIGQATISLAQTAFNPNMILSNEEDTRSGLNKLNNQSNLFKSTKSIYLLNDLANKLKSNRLNSWQVRVQLIELKHILGHNENVYCTVQIANQMFKSSVKPVENLKFNDVGFYLFPH